MSGHVFVIRADIRRLACDAWLMPCNVKRHSRNHWHKDIPGVPEDWQPEHPEGAPLDTWSMDRTRVLEISNWPTGLPKPWLVNVRQDVQDPDALTDREVEWFVAGVAQFFQVVARALVQKRVLSRRAKPLIALPIVGTGKEGAPKRVHQIMQALLHTMYEAARSDDVDVALVAYRDSDYAAAMHVRSTYAREHGVWTTALTKEQRGHAKRLAEIARQGKLALFIGAGVSAGAGIPLWKELLERLACRADINGAHLDSFHKMDSLDQGSLVAQRLRRLGRDVDQEVADIIDKYQHYALGHALLAALPVGQVVTTNYDTLFETASERMGREIAVIPYEPANTNRWLLKLHGCVQHPEDIVLVRSDYIRYDERRAALRGIVQAALITCHMLFVGFSLTDDNFYDVVDDVRRAIGGEQQDSVARTQDQAPNQFGTMLRLQHDPLIEELWADDLECISFGEEGTEGIASAARVQEMFVDYVASLVSDTSAYLMDDRFEYLLSDEQKTLKEALRALAEGMYARELTGLQAWQEIERMLKRFGDNTRP